MRIAVVYSLPTSHYLHTKYAVTEEDTHESAEEVAEALVAKGYNNPFLFPVFADHLEIIAGIQADLIFNLIEWTGPDLPAGIAATARIEKRGLPFTGATSVNYARMADKATHKEDLTRIGSPTPAYQVFQTGFEKLEKLPYPLIIKLTLEHCSIGIDASSIVWSQPELTLLVAKKIAEFKQPVLAEEFIPGVELQVTCLETEVGLKMLPPAEIYYKSKNSATQFLTYSSRWEEDHPEYNQSGVRLAKLDAALLKKIENICFQAFITLKYRDYARFDLRLRGQDVYILEANCNPGLGDSDEYGMTVSYKALGMTFADFIDEIVKSCLRRFKIKQSPETSAESES